MSAEVVVSVGMSPYLWETISSLQPGGREDTSKCKVDIFRLKGGNSMSNTEEKGQRQKVKKIEEI